MQRRLLACWYRANSADIEEGMRWYQHANQIAARIANANAIEHWQACGVIAALSPGLRWDLNIAHAEILIGEYQAGLRGRRLSIVGAYGRRNLIKAISILSGSAPLDVLGGSKVRSFYCNILDFSASGPITIDRHAKCAAYGVKDADTSFVRESEYSYIADHYRKCAQIVGVIPNQFQAVVWVCWRRLNGVLAQADLFADEVPF